MCAKNIIYYLIAVVTVFSYACVDHKDAGRIPVTGITLDTEEVVLAVGCNITLNAAIEPEDATFKTVIWNTSDPNVVAVDSSRHNRLSVALKPLMKGNATITVSSEDGNKTAKCEITVAEGMSMTTTENTGEMKFYIAGSGKFSIFWDEGKIETKELSECNSSDWNSLQSKYEYKHVYSGTAERSVTIAGGNITHLICSRLKLNSLVVSDNTALTLLDCSDNQFLTTLDVSNNKKLTQLYCNYNKITELNVNNNLALTILDCRNNELTGLDVGNNTLLKELRLSDGNQVGSLTVNTNTELTILDCRDNKIAALDVTKNTALTILDCRENNITILDVTKNTALTQLSCSSNKLTALNISQNTELVDVYCRDNQLTSLDLSKNGKLIILDCSNNSFNAAALNALIGTLHSNISDITKNIYIQGQTTGDTAGAAAHNDAISKGWTLHVTN